MVIWGTDVVVADTKERFRQFILNFKDESVEEYDPTQALYLQKLEEVCLIVLFSSYLVYQDYLIYFFTFFKLLLLSIDYNN